MRTCFLICMSILVCTGCASVQQEQVFRVEGEPDPVTGEPQRAYYRMTITGNANLLGRYSIKASYVSATAVDSLNGKLPKIPEADLAFSNERVFNEIKNKYLDLTKKTADGLNKRATTKLNAAGTVDTEQLQQIENTLTSIARMGWFSTLSDTDLQSMGSLDTVNPFEFRKLVFYAAGKTIDLKRYEAEITSAIEKTATLARYLKNKSIQDRPPTVSNVTVSDISDNQIALTWKMPGPESLVGIVVLQRDATSPVVRPSDGSLYTAGTSIGSSKVVTAGVTNSALANQLQADKEYAFDVFTYNSQKLYGSAVSIAARTQEKRPQKVQEAKTTVDGQKFKIEFKTPKSRENEKGYVIVRVNQAAAHSYKGIHQVLTKNSNYVKVAHGDITDDDQSISFNDDWMAQGNALPDGTYRYFIYIWSGTSDAPVYSEGVPTNSVTKP